MTAQALPYGAIELKHVAQRNWTFGFVLSLLFHLLVLSAYFLTGRYSAGELNIPPQRPGDVEIHLNPTTQPSTFDRLHAGAAIAPRIIQHVATPVPVPEHLVVQTPEGSSRPGLPGESEGPEHNGGEPWGTGPVEESEPPPFRVVEKLPSVIISDTPVYPAIALKAGLEGKVWVNIWVDSGGRVRKAVVLNSTNDIFNESAIASAYKFVFTPAYMSSGAVAVWVVVPFVFRLR